MLDEYGLPLEVSKSYLSEEEKLIIRHKKVKKAKASIVFSALACLSSFVVFGCIFLKNIDIPFELILFSAFIGMIFGCIISGILSTSAKSKVNRQQVLEGKSWRCVKAAVIMTYVALALCVLCFEIYLILIYFMFSFISIFI
ncbi:MAG: hypothetical protein K2L70_08425 [Clostridia bacterium]|nr:hypothetical protein [Clostridia bacterium]